MRFPPCVSTSRSHKDKFPQASEAAESHGSVPKTYRSFTQTASAAGGPLPSPSPPLPPQIMVLVFPQAQGSVPSPGGQRGAGGSILSPPKAGGARGQRGGDGNGMERAARGARGGRLTAAPTGRAPGVPPGRGARLLEEAGVNAQQRHVPPQRPVIASPRKQLPRKRLGGAGDKPLFIGPAWTWKVPSTGGTPCQPPGPEHAVGSGGGCGGWPSAPGAVQPFCCCTLGYL